MARRIIPTGVSLGDPEPEPLLNLVQARPGNDRLHGAAGGDLIRGGDGDDRVTGGAGEDRFVCSADARDGKRDRDVITDFNAAEDTVVVKVGARVRCVEERNGDLSIQGFHRCSADAGFRLVR